jgi:hypothetical protein
MPLEDYTRLKRRRLDRQLASLTPLREMTPPARGWINAIRSALGMSARQLGERFDASPQIAEALDGRIVVAFVPNETLERTVQRQAERKAIAHRDRVVHTMRLEAQDAGVEESLTVDPTYWTTVRASALWD